MSRDQQGERNAPGADSRQTELREYFPSLGDVAWARLHRYYELLVAWNEKMNLTAIIDEREVYIKHYFDSFMVRELDMWTRLQHGARIADVGTGAGFPGMVLAIAEPEKQFVLFDALNKRIRFLDTVIHELGLANVELVHGRAEDVGHLPSYRETFDVVFSRAVARLNVLAEYGIPLLRVGGSFIAYKGPTAADEALEATSAVKKLGGSELDLVEMKLPLEMGTRFFITLRKLTVTPLSYPRQAGTPQRFPIS